MPAKECLEKIRFNADGLVPAIVQDARSRRVLMMAWMNAESLLATLDTGKTHFWSRSRKKLWIKGETSGHVQHVRRIFIDCDGDTILVEVDQVGAACHEGYESCFFQEIDREGRLKPVEETRKFDPKQKYRE